MLFLGKAQSVLSILMGFAAEVVRISVIFLISGSENAPWFRDTAPGNRISEKKFQKGVDVVSIRV